MSASPPSIRRQVLFFTFTVSLTVLLITGGVLLTHHIGQTRARLADALDATAQMIAANASAALAFRDEAGARDVLASLRHDPLIVSAILFDQNDAPFVAYGRPTDFDPAKPSLSRYGPARILDVVHNGETYGRLLVVTDNRDELRRTALTWGSVYAGAVLFTALLAYALSFLFQRAIATPLAALARTAVAVSERGDYTARATPGGPAEVAAVAEAFNAMLAEIGRRDAELARQLTALDKEMHEREAAEASLRQNTRELLRLSHEAGMAEVATGVLHNIGNALNSINVSAELLADHLRLRATPGIATLRDFFQNPPAKAAPVFQAHPGGPDVLAFADSLASHAHAQLRGAAQELATLRTGVAHLKEIVARQQSLAKSIRHNERFDLREALQEALLLDKTTGHTHTPQLLLEQTHEGPTLVHADRSAVVQILVNLLANARAAVVQSRAPLIRIHVGPPNATHLPLSITDNGVGIHPDQLLSIFSYGFTTKSGGHGFGLHNAAITARLLGGTIRVHSEGPGLGATFILDLPLRPSSSSHAAS
ncbi:MAG: ATP-binding protein [Opitutaceae bacterium]|jgi:C4-dicarboxylate-specific signal transduction histidine kinase|nr:ATP-binding protein [Opitutaceae bacterium]